MLSARGRWDHDHDLVADGVGVGPLLGPEPCGAYLRRASGLEEMSGKEGLGLLEAVRWLEVDAATRTAHFLSQSLFNQRRLLFQGGIVFNRVESPFDGRGCGF